ncbi:ComEC/Rec2 family competence protein [Cognatishimia sp. SS12]|nr:ComEC/Rec2 family competence protein [Cognatishimia sp. SS12]
MKSAILAQDGALFPWVPVAFGCGIGVFFALDAPPSGTARAALSLLLMACIVLAWRLHVARWFALACAIGLAGFLWMDLRSDYVNAPRLAKPYYGAVSGRVVLVDRSAAGTLRLTLENPVMAGQPPAQTPHRLRFSMQAAQSFLSPRAGQFVSATVWMAPPSGAVEPGGFDFQRHAYFSRIGATGYSRVPVLALRAPRAGPSVAGLRQGITDHILTQLAPRLGGVAAALMTGDRSGILPKDLRALRRSNLAHLLAISGLHMGLLAAVSFAAARFGLCLMSGVALRHPVKRYAAIVALMVATGYLLLSGASIATQRAYIMALVALVAVLLERQAFSMRALAVAALIVLGVRPESLLSVGFQMSFAATGALIAVFEALRHLPLQRAHWVFRWAAGVVVSSAVAGLATAPFSAASFNILVPFGLLANLLAVPMMGLLVMPAALAALLLWPLGLSFVGFWVMGLGLRWILGVAHWVSGLEGGLRHVPAPPAAAMLALCFGFLVLLLWQGRGRWLGGGVLLMALVVWANSPRPDLLIAENGRLVGLMTPEGRALSRSRGQGFIAAAWLQNDGDAAHQEVAAARLTSLRDDIYVVPLPIMQPAHSLAQPADHAAPRHGHALLWHVSNKAELAIMLEMLAREGCRPGDIIVSALPFGRGADPALARSLAKCRIFDADSLARTGALSVSIRSPEKAEWLRADGAGGRYPTPYIIRQSRSARRWHQP